MTLLHANAPRALILAAGRGKRLMPLTKNIPKCLVRVGRKPILYYQLSALRKYGVAEIVVIAGYKENAIREYVQKEFPEFKTIFVSNPKYETTEDIYSLYLAKNYLDEDCLLLDSDVLFHHSIIGKLLTVTPYLSYTAIKKVPCGEEEMKASVDKNGMVTKLSKELVPSETAGEFLSITFFRKPFLKHLVCAMRKTINSTGKKTYATVAIEKVISDGKGKLACLDITSYPAMEIDFPSDLKIATEQVLPKIAQELL
ncbi:MAG: phosphocholine cytidylyltransferase family protein [bacterium]|nr:phosphocholine cytidylyltransferase family protein [bacterium]